MKQSVVHSVLLSKRLLHCCFRGCKDIEISLARPRAAPSPGDRSDQTLDTTTATHSVSMCQGGVARLIGGGNHNLVRHHHVKTGTSDVCQPHHRRQLPTASTALEVAQIVDIQYSLCT